MTLQTEVSEKMEQTELLTIIGTNSITGLISAAILVFGFVKGLDLLHFGTLPLAFIGVFIVLFLAIYYKYFLTNMEFTHNTLLTWKDFLYNDVIDKFDNISALIVSALCAIGAEVCIVIAYLIAEWLWVNSDSPIVLTGIRIGLLGLIASVFFAYAHRNYFGKEKFWETTKKCILYGFGLSIAFYSLGIIVGIAVMVFGLPITIAIVVLQFAFTSVYTYIDLVEWAKKTRKIAVKTSFSSEEVDKIVNENIKI